MREMQNALVRIRELQVEESARSCARFVPLPIRALALHELARD